MNSSLGGVDLFQSAVLQVRSKACGGTRNRTHTPRGVYHGTGQGGDISLDPSPALLAPKDSLLCFTRGFMGDSGGVRPHAWMHASAVYMPTSSWERNQADVCVDTPPPSHFFPSLCSFSPPAIHLSLNPSLSFKSLLGNPIPFISTKRLAY